MANGEFIVMKSVVPLLRHHENPSIRRGAAPTSVRLLLPSLDQLLISESEFPLRSAFLGTGGALERQPQWQRVVLCHTDQLCDVAAVLRRVLEFCVQDPDPQSRRLVLQQLDARFDPFLCEPHHAALLCRALDDGELLVRKAVVQIMGRPSGHNPAYVVPALWRLLVRVLAELEHAPELRWREEAAEMLTTMSLHTHTLLEPHVRTVGQCLVGELKEAIQEGNSKFVGLLLEAIAQLTEVDSDQVKPFLKELITHLIEMVQHVPRGEAFLAPRHQKREQAYRTLRVICESTGHDPLEHEQHLTLLPLLLDNLRSDAYVGDSQQRQQIMRCIGTLGALDPLRFEKIARQKARKELHSGVDGQALAVLEDEISARIWQWLRPSAVRDADSAEPVDMFAVQAVVALLKLLRESTGPLGQSNTVVVQTLMKIVRTSLDKNNVTLISQIFAALKEVVRVLPAAEIEALVTETRKLLGHWRGQGVSKHIQNVFSLISCIWHLS